MKETCPRHSLTRGPGNHDITLDADFYAIYDHEFHNKKTESHEECLGLLKTAPSLTYLQHETTTIKLSSPTGPRTQFTVFGSPRAPLFGKWAFYYPPYHRTDPSLHGDVLSTEEQLRSAPWDDIPARADIVVTHTPPRGHCDDCGGVDRPAGCEALRRALWRVRPRLAVCGHMHEGRGVARVSWDLNCRYGERAATEEWEDPGAGGGNKISLVDLTGRKGQIPLENDGLWEGEDGDGDGRGFSGRGAAAAAAAEVDLRNGAPGWHGRRETCIVNAAVLKSRFPHAGGKQFYKPIVVDLDLPVVDDDESE